MERVWQHYSHLWTTLLVKALLLLVRFKGGKKGSSRLLWGGHSPCQKGSLTSFQAATQDTRSWRDLFMQLKLRNEFSALESGLQFGHTIAIQLSRRVPNLMTVGHKQQDVATFFFFLIITQISNENKKWRNAFLAWFLKLKFLLFFWSEVWGTSYEFSYLSQALDWDEPSSFLTYVVPQMEHV